MACAYHFSMLSAAAAFRRLVCIPSCRSLDSLATDPVLSFITTHVNTLSRHGAIATQVPLRRAGGLASPGGSDSWAASSSAASSGLSPEVQLWEVQWDSIVLQRPIGRGSFGRVYLAQWNATPASGAALPAGAQPASAALAAISHVLLIRATFHFAGGSQGFADCRWASIACTRAYVCSPGDNAL